MLGDQKRITTINNLKTINTNIKIIQTYLISIDIVREYVKITRVYD